MITDTSTVHAPKGRFAALTIAAMGIVYGAIGTSPLYALNQLFFGLAKPQRTPDNVIGGLSLVIWTITIIVAIEYAVFVLRAQNDGEGGLFALYGLLHEYKNRGTRNRGTRVLIWSLMLGAGVLFSDGFITPAISVLSALEGLDVATPAFAGMVVPIAVVLFTALFAVQFKGTSGIGRVFGLILLVWFVVIAVLGAMQIAHQPEILAAFDPTRGLRFLARTESHQALLVLAALMLVVGGAEAMYADLGHFGAKPIRTSWFAVVYPALLLNYLGQGAYLLSRAPVVGGNIFFSIVPPGLLYPMVLLATLATVIASQALISGVFSLTAQAIRLGLFPRLVVRHTHHSHAGQIYIPFINWSLLVGCILLVVCFGSSTRLGAAYGLTVSGVMVITSVSMIAIARFYWEWGVLRIAALWGTLTAINAAFLLASTMKFLEGGFVPLTIGTIVFLMMATWRWGRKATFAAYSAHPAVTMAELVRLHHESSVFMERNAILMAPKPLRLPTDRAPALLRLLWEPTASCPATCSSSKSPTAKSPTSTTVATKSRSSTASPDAAASSPSNSSSASWRNPTSSASSQKWLATSRSTCPPITGNGSSTPRWRTYYPPATWVSSATYASACS